MSSIFFICFGVGVGFIVLNSFLGELFSSFDIDTDFDFGTGVSPLKPIVLSVFLTVFGGSGLILSKYLWSYTAFVLAVVLGSFMAYIIFRFVVVPLTKIASEKTAERQDLIGHAAQVVESIPQGKYGKIKYFVNGNTYTAPAKSESGNEIKRYVDVEIIYIEKNTFFVKERYVQ